MKKRRAVKSYGMYTGACPPLSWLRIPTSADVGSVEKSPLFLSTFILAGKIRPECSLSSSRKKKKTHIRGEGDNSRRFRCGTDTLVSYFLSLLSISSSWLKQSYITQKLIRVVFRFRYLYFLVNHRCHDQSKDAFNISRKGGEWTWL